MRLVSLLFLAMLVAGCSSRARKAIETPVARACDGPRFDVPERVLVTCWPQVPCRASFEYALENCTEKPLQLLKTLVGMGKSDLVEVAFDVPMLIAPHSTVALTFPPKGLRYDLGFGPLRLVAILAASPAALPKGDIAVAIDRLLVDPAHEQAVAECTAGGGEWMSVGIFGTEVCLPIMPDAGASCVDERDCQGYCFLDRAVPISRDEQRVFGTCSRFRSRFGCHTYVGKTNKGIVSLKRRFVHVCVD